MSTQESTLNVLTEIKEALCAFTRLAPKTLTGLIGKQVIIRTYSAGVWFGILEQKAGKEVVLKDARRMYKWWAKKGISLSAVCLYGIKQEESKIIEPIDNVWLEAIEIMPCSEIAIKDLKEAPAVEAQ